MNTDYTINETQFDILSALQSVQPLTLAMLATYTGASYASFTRAQLDLRLREFVTSEKSGIHRSLQLSITSQGVIALNAYRKRRELLARQPVTATRINLMAQPVWKPPVWHLPARCDCRIQNFGATA